MSPSKSDGEKGRSSGGRAPKPRATVPPGRHGGPGEDETDLDLETRLVDGLRPDRPELQRLVVPDERFPALVKLAERHAVDGLLAAALTRAGTLGRLRAETADVLRRAALRRHREWIELQRVLQDALGLLAGAGVPVIVLKGAALAIGTYAEPELRPMNDIDLLVPPDAVDVAAGALRSGGFLVPDEARTEFWKDAYFHLPLRAPGDGFVLVELHWAIAQPDRHRPDTTELFGAAVPLAESTGAALMLGPEDMLTHLALHHSYHYFEPRLIWIHDLALLHLDPPPASHALARARRWQATVPFLLALAQVERVFPGLLRPEFRQLAARSARVRWLLRLFGSGRPMPLFGGWSRRRTQLLLGSLMLDSPLQMLRATAGWTRRSRRFGDRTGRRPEMSDPRRGAI